MSVVNLSKAVAVGERVNLSKANPGVLKFSAGLNWNMKPGIDADCDLTVLLLDADGNAIGQRKVATCLCFYGNPTLPGVMSYGDNQTGDDSETQTPSGSDEQIDVDLGELPAEAAQVIIIATTHSEKKDANGNATGESDSPMPFGRVAAPTVKIFDNSGATPKELYFTELDEDFSAATSLECAKFYLKNGDWRYVSMGDEVGRDAFGLQGIVDRYSLVG